MPAPLRFRIYIPLCFYFIQFQSIHIDPGLLHLHSTMLLLYPMRNLNRPDTSEFTFHYASTLSEKGGLCGGPKAKFTFHYASTLSAQVGIAQVGIAHLHSTMLLLYRYKQRHCWDKHPHLHSTMLLLYPDVPCPCKDRARHLHSTMLLLYRRSITAWEPATLTIYIPLCFYFITMRNLNRPDTSEFTFHYASTLSERRKYGICANDPFTFHYASTLSRPRFPLLFSSIQVYFLSTPLSSYLSSQKSSSSHFTKFKFSLIFQALSISQQFSSISGRQS